MKNAGIKLEKTASYFIRLNLEDQFLYSGKHDPGLYFDEKVRHGISSFASLANNEEVEKGLSALRTDIASGKIQEIINSNENTLGDYLFAIGRKK